MPDKMKPEYQMTPDLAFAVPSSSEEHGGQTEPIGNIVVPINGEVFKQEKITVDRPIPVMENSSVDIELKIESVVEPADKSKDETSQSTGVADVFRVMAVSVVMGFASGVIMERAKVSLPTVVREHFLFCRFIMLKMFLSACATSALVLAFLSRTAPRRFAIARQEYMSCFNGKGLLAVAAGSTLVGAGMALAGSCPGMVLVQVGSGVDNSGVSVAGALTAAALYGAVQPMLVPWLCGGMVVQEKAEDFRLLQRFRFWQISGAFGVAMAGLAAILEVVVPWTSAGELVAPWGEAWTNTWPPILGGAVMGSLQVPAVLWIGDTLGSSSSYMTFTAQWLGLSPALQTKFPHWSGFRNGLGNWWQLWYVLASVGGAFCSASVGGTLGKAGGVAAADAFIGGFLIVFGARIASGCTIGHGLSGMPLLSVHSAVGVPAIFAGGIAVAFVYAAASESYV